MDDPSFRRIAASKVRNTQVRNFWLRAYESYPARFRAEAIAPVQNKVRAFLADLVLNAILPQPKSAFDLRSIMDKGKILLVNLAKAEGPAILPSRLNEGPCCRLSEPARSAL
jgi:hypothetical protein